MPIIAGTWTLESKNTKVKTESAFLLQHAKLPVVVKGGQPLVSPYEVKRDGSESLMPVDKRKPVKASDLAKGAKYRPIVKLFIRYEGQEPDDGHAMGTGWMIAPDLLVTAGHCSFDQGDVDRPAYGRAVEIIVHIGYNGAGSVTKEQTSHGIKIVTTKGWLKTADHQNDVSFVKIDPPFTEIDNNTALTYEATPLTGKEAIGVVGYPGDMHDGSDEYGAQMYEEFKTVNWSLSNAPGNMLKYDINTYAGQSGSPVLLQKDLKVSLGAHVYGGYGYNLASTISDSAIAKGNRYKRYIDAIYTDYPKPLESKGGVDFIDITPSGEEAGGLSHPDPFWHSVIDAVLVNKVPEDNNTAEGYFAAGPFGGIIGAQSSVLVSHCFRVCGKSLTESSWTGNTAPPKQSTIERAILAECALQVAIGLGSRKCKALGITEKTESLFGTLAGFAKKAATKVLPVIKDVALNLLQDAVKPKGSEDSFAGTSPVEIVEQDQLDRVNNEFAKKLLEPTVRVGDESIFSMLPGLLSSALSGGGALGIGLKVVSGLLSGGEASFKEGPHDENYRVLAKRAALAEATLQAFQETPVDVLQRENIFSKIKDLYQKVAPTVLKYGPKVADAVGPVLTTLLKNTAKADPEFLILGRRRRTSNDKPARDIGIDEEVEQLVAPASFASKTPANPKLGFKTSSVRPVTHIVNGNHGGSITDEIGIAA